MSRSLVAIEELANQFGLKRNRSTPGRAPPWQIECSACHEPETFGWAASMPPFLMVKKLRQRGWQLSEKAPPVCPECQKKEKTVAKQEIGPDPKIARKIYSALDEHFDESTHLYRAGWDDARIAKEIDTALVVVIRIRRDAYGELAETPEIPLLRDDLELLRMETTELQDKFMKELSAQLAKIAAIEERIGKVGSLRKAVC